MIRIAPFFIVSMLCLACSGEVPPDAAAHSMTADPPQAGQGMPTDRISVAMSGAPTDVASEARIMDFDSSGNMIELRAGSNGWMCLVDDTPAAPGDSPDCLDSQWQQWFEAYAKHEVPQVSGVGLAYMLRGGLSPSNTDPFAELPPAGEAWMEDGPHLMLIVPDSKMLDGFPSEHVTGGPYVMYRGTPYAHLMVPVAGH